MTSYFAFTVLEKVWDSIFKDYSRVWEGRGTQKRLNMAVKVTLITGELKKINSEDDYV